MEESLKDDNTPYKVFTPFYKKTYLSKELDLKLYDLPNLDNILEVSNTKYTLDSLKLLPSLKWGKMYYKIGVLEKMRP